MTALRGRVLVVDDEVGVLDALSVVLAGRGYEARAVRSGEEAVAVLGVEGVHAVVADERMPGMRGTEVLAHAARLHPLPVGSCCPER